MSATYIIWRRETRSIFTSFAIYAKLSVWLMAFGWHYMQTLRYGEGDFTPLAIFWTQSMALWLPALCAAATMRRFAGESESGTLETLLTAPVNEVEIVSAKFWASMTVVVVGLLLSLIGPLIVLPRLAPALLNDSYSQLLPILAGTLALLLQATLWVAIGLWFSLFCQHAVLSAGLTLIVTLILPNIPAIAGRIWTPMTMFTAAGLPSIRMAGDMTSGLFATAPLICHLAALGCTLFLTVRLLESRYFKNR